MSLYLGLPQWSHPAWPGQLLGLGEEGVALSLG